MKKIIAAIVLVLVLFVHVTPILASGDFSTNVRWTGSDIEISWENFMPNTKFFRKFLNITVVNKNTGKSAKIKTPNKKDKILLSKAKWADGTSIKSPKEGETWEITFETPAGNVFTKKVKCECDASVNNLHNWHWPVVLFWYKILASLSGVFIFFTLIRCGYQYMHTQNAGTRASVISTIQKCILAIVFIIIAPAFINLLIQINDAFVKLCLNILEQITAPSKNVDLLQTVEDPDGRVFIGTIIAWPVQKLMNFINSLFGLSSIGTVIFNESPALKTLENSVFSGQLNTGNVFSSMFLNASFMGFTLYFNAVYIIRKWVVMIVVAVTPLILWIWVLSEKREVMEIWFAEVLQTIFMQTFHALAFGIVLSILYCPKEIPKISLTASTSMASALVVIGTDIAYFAGIICAGVIMFSSYRIICAATEEQRAVATTTLTRSLAGLMIIGVSLMITSFLVGEGTIPLIIPEFTGGTAIGKITFWELFFALLTIVPVSKMLSSIFMSILSRIGTVDEHAVAAKGLAGLGQLGKTAAVAIRRNIPIPSNDGGIFPGTMDGMSGGTVPSPTINNASSSWGSNFSSSSFNSQLMKKTLGGQPYQNFVDKLQTGGRQVGMISGVTASPATGMALGAFFGGAAKTAGTMGYTAKAMAAGTQLFSKDNPIPISERIQDFTGRDTPLGGAAQMATGVFLSPLGPKVATWTGNISGAAVDTAAGGIVDLLRGGNNEVV